MNALPRHADTQFQLWFRPLSVAAPAYAFPCDACGCFDLDELHARERIDYLFARTLVGRDFERPTVQRAVRPAAAPC